MSTIAEAFGLSFAASVIVVFIYDTVMDRIRERKDREDDDNE